MQSWLSDAAIVMTAMVAAGDPQHGIGDKFTGQKTRYQNRPISSA
ncbi:hypothetical protein [Serratia sp. M24T3]|nr:hypothetical protein [Serratia sp. M24T3]